LRVGKDALFGHAVQDRIGQRRYGRAGRQKLLHEHVVIKGVVLHEGGPSGQPGCESHGDADGAGERKRIEEDIAAVERQGP